MRYFLFSLLSTISLFASLNAPFAYGGLLPPANGETPASLACIYGLTPYVPGCPIKNTRMVPQTGSGAIAIIDGQDDPNAYTELQQFSSQFKLHQLPECNGGTSACFQQYYVTPSVTPPCISVTDAKAAGHDASYYNIGQATDIEPELDIEWAHAMAPYATIYMVETQGWGDDKDPNNPNITSLVNGLQCATYLLINNHGGGIISYSHSFSEWSGETSYDSYFQTPGIIYIASSGDYSSPARYPASSPYVIAAGGTSIQRNSLGNYIGQVAWHDNNKNDCNPICKTGTSGGPSHYEPRPIYQNSVQKIVGNHRGTPDISFAAEGIDVFCCKLSSPSNKCCDSKHKPACQSVDTNLCLSGRGAWVTTGGTSLASPALAGILNSAHSGATTSSQELSIIYYEAIKNYHSYWTDITSGNNGYPALVGYDFTTGLGVARGYGGK